jgi:hypothetical protein
MKVILVLIMRPKLIWTLLWKTSCSLTITRNLELSGDSRIRHHIHEPWQVASLLQKLIIRRRTPILRY